MKRNKRKYRAYAEAEKQAKQAKKPGVKGEIIGLLLCIPFLLIGFAFIKIGISEFSDLKSCTEETTAIVNEVTEYKKKKSAGAGYIRSYTAYYTYEYHNEPYKSTLNSTNKIKEGKVLKIKFDPENPKHHYVKWHANSGNVFLIIFGIVWDGIFLIIMYAIFISIFEKKFKKNKDDTSTEANNTTDSKTNNK